MKKIFAAFVALLAIPLALSQQGGGIQGGGSTVPNTSQGDLLYASATNTLTSLAKSPTATRYLANTGTNNNPAWAQVTLTNGVTGTLPVGNGGTGNTAATDDALLLGNGTNFPLTVVPDCTDTGGNHLNYTAASNAFSCGTSSSFSGTSASLGGGALLAGACASNTTTVTGAATTMAAIATPNTYPGDGSTWSAQVTSANTVTVRVCAIVALTPSASTYNIRVIR